jgi:Putative DNA-binding domain
MLSLTKAQANFIETINSGPTALDPALFAGPIDRVMLGLKAHANTISHARLVALEETFPLTRREMGEAKFNAIARDFVETNGARASDNSDIGRNFPKALDDPALRELAAIEWAWLESYHAAEAEPFTLDALRMLDEAALIEFPVAPHPSARLVSISHPIANALEELAGQHPHAIMCARPDAEVRFLPLNITETAVFLAASGKDATLGNLLATAIELSAETEPTGPVMKLIGAGALVAGG